jgi:hypothetical protein
VHWWLTTTNQLYIQVLDRFDHAPRGRERAKELVVRKLYHSDVGPRRKLFWQCTTQLVCRKRSTDKAAWLLDISSSEQKSQQAIMSRHTSLLGLPVVPTLQRVECRSNDCLPVRYAMPRDTYSQSVVCGPQQACAHMCIQYL